MDRVFVPILVLLQILEVTSSAPPASVETQMYTCTFPSGYEQAASGADKAYMKKDGYGNFMEALETCQADGAHLVMLKTEQDVEDIRDFVRI